jgi:hypothetical protein
MHGKEALLCQAAAHCGLTYDQAHQTLHSEHYDGPLIFLKDDSELWRQLEVLASQTKPLAARAGEDDDGELVCNVSGCESLFNHLYRAKYVPVGNAKAEHLAKAWKMLQKTNEPAGRNHDTASAILGSLQITHPMMPSSELQLRVWVTVAQRWWRYNRPAAKAERRQRAAWLRKQEEAESGSDSEEDEDWLARWTEELVSEETQEAANKGTLAAGDGRHTIEMLVRAGDLSPLMLVGRWVVISRARNIGRRRGGGEQLMDWHLAVVIRRTGGANTEEGELLSSAAAVRYAADGIDSGADLSAKRFEQDGGWEFATARQARAGRVLEAAVGTLVGRSWYDSTEGHEGEYAVVKVAVTTDCTPSQRAVFYRKVGEDGVGSESDDDEYSSVSEVLEWLELTDALDCLAVCSCTDAPAEDAE